MSKVRLEFNGSFLNRFPPSIKRIVTRGNILLRGNVWLLEEMYCYQREKNITSEMIGRISRKNSQSGNFSLYMLGGIAFSLTTRKAEFEK